MPNINEVVEKPSKSRIKQLEAQVETLKGRLAESKSALDVGKVNLQAKVSTLTAQNKKLIATEARIQEFASSVVEAVQALDPLPLVNILRPKKSKTPMTAVLHLTDWHIGERSRPKETEGWGNFDWEVAQDRVLGQLVPRFLQWVNTQRSGYDLYDLKVLCTGDFISGDIHDELRRTNEFPIPIQTANAGDLLGHVGHALASHFEKVGIVEIGADNHSRLVQKPQAKQKTQNSMSHLVYHILNKEMSKHSNVEIDQADGMKHLFRLGPAEIPFLGEHGDTIKSWMGVPWYGMERERAREATRRMFDNRGFKFMIIGHWHQYFFGPIIVGGCLSGTSEYDHSCGRTSPPTQTAFLVGKRGPFNFIPFELK